jgi:pyruvate kinase
MGVTRRTRILATIGPSSQDPAAVRELIESGVNAFRLNFSHGTHDTHAESYRRIRDAASAAGRPVAILQDLGGPKIRTGLVPSPLALVPDAPLVIERGDAVGEPGRVSCTFDALFASARAGERLLVDDGRIELRVTSATASRIETIVVLGGQLDSHKGINLPGVPILTSAVTAKDEDDLRFGVSLGVDLVAISFVQTPEDVRHAKAIAVSAGAYDLPVIAKIERPQAVEHIDDILDVADGLMVARGDLGIELPLETLPAVQKKLVRRARARGVPVIIATEVLESMRHEPRPTRAEVTDAAHAVDEDADAIMLSGETAMGEYPVRAVQMLDAIIREAEAARETTPTIVPEGAIWSAHGRALCEAAVTLAERANASAIVALTVAGKTARLLAALRPHAAIIAVTPHQATAAHLALVWGVTPLVTAPASLDAARAAIEARQLISPGSTIVLVSMRPQLDQEGRNFVGVERF